MQWQCALLQRWLPDYPDGELPSFWKRRLRSHLEHCSGCRRELAALKDVVAALKAAPVTEPEPEFWNQFSRELHLKLARVAHDCRHTPVAPPRPWWGRLPYLLGAPGLVILALWSITFYLHPQRAVVAPQPQRAQAPVLEKAAGSPAPRMAEAPPAPAAAPSKMVAAPPAAPAESLVYVTLNGAEALPEEEDDLDLSTSGLDSVLAGMSDQEKERFLNRLHQKKKDGSCLEKYSSHPLA